MFVLRPVKKHDLDDLMILAEVMAPGITTFPPNAEVLQNKILKSVIAFESPLSEVDTNRDFLLVLEDIDKNRVVGTTGIYSHIGQDLPFYSFKREIHTLRTQLPGRDKLTEVDSTTLHLTNDLEGGTEVGTLLLHPDYNGLGLGKLLAKARYLLIRSHSQLFTEPVFAELRGWSDEDNISPFWESIGRHFFAGMDYSTADYLSATTDKQFIADLFPRYPIYEDLLPGQARECINKANRKGQAALEMLYKEGFRDDGYVDIFDAGATVVANFDELETYKHANEYKVSPKAPQDDSTRALIANSDLANFRVTITTDYQLIDNCLFLTDQHKELLKLSPGNQAWLCQF